MTPQETRESGTVPAHAAPGHRVPGLRVPGLRVPGPGRRTFRWVGLAAVVAALACLGSMPGIAGSGIPGIAEHGGGLLTRELGRTPAQGRGTQASVLPPGISRADAVQGLLDHRAGAVLARQREAFLSDVDPGAPGFREQQAAFFDALADVPLAEWSYTVMGEGPPLSPTRAAELAAEAFVVRVLLRHRIDGFDGVPVTGEQQFTAVRRGERWFLAGDADGSSGGPPGRWIWDYGKVNVARGASSIVLGVGPVKVLARYAREADLAVPAVTSVWGPEWEQKVVILVPATRDQMAGLLGGQSGDYSRIAAVATGQVADPSRTRSADRVIVNPDAFDRLSASGRRVVLTHEVTHVATRAATRSTVPMWLAEGLADYVGYSRSGISARVAAGDLIRQVRAGRVPDRLPSDSDFMNRNARLSAAYEGSWLACLLIADRYGQDKLVDFYRAVGASPGTAGDAAVSGAFASVLGTTTERFVADWRSYLREQAR